MKTNRLLFAGLPIVGVSLMVAAMWGAYWGYALMMFH